jgi:hypothetical protein
MAIINTPVRHMRRVLACILIGALAFTLPVASQVQASPPPTC